MRTRPMERFRRSFPVLVAVLLLFVALSVNGAFAIRHWAPIALFVLVVLASAARRAPQRRAARRGRRPSGCSRRGRWRRRCGAHRPSRRLEQGGRTLLYAGLFALPLVTLRDRRSVQTVAAAALGGLALITLGTFVHVLSTARRRSSRAGSTIRSATATAPPRCSCSPSGRCCASRRRGASPRCCARRRSRSRCWPSAWRC